MSFQMEPSMIYSLIDLAQQKGTIFDCIFSTISLTCTRNE